MKKPKRKNKWSAYKLQPKPAKPKLSEDELREARIDEMQENFEVWSEQVLGDKHAFIPYMNMLTDALEEPSSPPPSVPLIFSTQAGEPKK